MREQHAEHRYLPRRASAPAPTTEQPSAGRRWKPPASSRHQVGHRAGLHPEDQPQQTYPSRATSNVDWDVEDDEAEEDRFALPTARLRPSAIRRDVAPSRRSRSLPADQHQERPHRYRHPHWMLRLGLALSLLLLSWLLLTEAATWTQQALDTLHYGYPRTYQTDAVVGHSDSPAHPATSLP